MVDDHHYVNGFISIYFIRKSSNLDKVWRGDTNFNFENGHNEK